MEKIKYDDIRLDIEEESKKYQLDEAKEIRWSISKLQSDCAYFQYRIYLCQKKINKLNEKYKDVLGGEEDAPVKEE